MEVIQCGTLAITKNENHKGFITATTIRFNKISYEFSYFYKGDYKQIWLNECEFSIENDLKIEIGFKNNK